MLVRTSQIKTWATRFCIERWSFNRDRSKQVRDAQITTWKSVKKELDRRLGFVDFARGIHFISALHGTGVVTCLNRFKRLTSQRQLVLVRLSQSSYHEDGDWMITSHLWFVAVVWNWNTRTRVITHQLSASYGNQVRDLPDSYKRFLRTTTVVH